VLYDLDDYIMSLKMPWGVKQIADALRGITENAFRDRYFCIDQEDYDGYEYTWSWFQEVRELYDRAADAGRPVLLQRQLGIHLLLCGRLNSNIESLVTRSYQLPPMRLI
jgi:Domain of unknown function (DUF1877)